MKLLLLHNNQKSIKLKITMSSVITRVFQHMKPRPFCYWSEKRRQNLLHVENT